jgi:hypothetical protein
MLYIIDNNGFYLGLNTPKAVEEQGLLFVTIAPPTEFIKAKWNGTLWIEGATQEEIDEANKPIVPDEVQLWRVRTVLKLLGMEQVIEVALNSLPEPTKTGALYIWNYGTTVERNSQTVLLLQSVLGLTDAQTDDIFIQAQNIVI